MRQNRLQDKIAELEDRFKSDPHDHDTEAQEKIQS